MLRNLEGHVIGGSGVISAHENLPALGTERSKPTRFGFTTKKPVKPGQLVIHELVDRSEEEGIGRVDSNPSGFTITLCVHVADIASDVRHAVSTKLTCEGLTSTRPLTTNTTLST